MLLHANPDIDGDVNLRLRLSLRVQGFVPPDTSGDEELPSAPATSVGVHHGVGTRRIIRSCPPSLSSRRTADDPHRPRRRRARRPRLRPDWTGESLLHTIERELWKTQLELSRRFIADRETDIEKLNHQNEMSGMAHQKAQGRISELETALASERSQHDGLEAHAREASKGLCAILGTSFGGEGSDSVPSLKQLVKPWLFGTKRASRKSPRWSAERSAARAAGEAGAQGAEAEPRAVKTAWTRPAPRGSRAAGHRAPPGGAPGARRARRTAAGAGDALSTDLEQRKAALDAAQEVASGRAGGRGLREEARVPEAQRARGDVAEADVEAQISTLQHENKQLKQKVDERESWPELQARVLDATRSCASCSAPSARRWPRRRRRAA